MSARAQYDTLMGQMNPADVLAEMDEVYGIYNNLVPDLEKALGHVTVIQESLAAEHNRGAQALGFIEAASASLHSPDVLEPAHTDMATATGELAAARHEVNQSQQRFSQAMNTTEQQKGPISRCQQECSANAADLKDMMDKLQMLGGLAAGAKALLDPDG